MSATGNDYLAGLYRAAVALEGIAHPYCSRQRSAWKRAHERLDAAGQALFSADCDDGDWTLRVSAFWVTYQDHLRKGYPERARRAAVNLIRDVQEDILGSARWRLEGILEDSATEDL